MADIQANIGIGVDTSQALAAIRQLQREISVFHTLMAKGGANAAAKSMAMQQGLINTINETGKFSASMTRISSSTESFTNALEKNKLSMGQYFRYAGGASKTFGKVFSREFNTVNKVAQERVKDLQTQYISMGRDANGALQAVKVRPLALDMDNLGTKVQLAAQKQQIFNQLMKQGTTNLLNFGKNTQWAGRQLMVGFTIPLTIFGATAAREFQKLEEQAVKFRRVYGDMFTTDADTEKALSNVRELAEEFTKYGIAVEKTIGLAAKVAQMGNVGADLTEQVTQATRLAVLGGLEQEQALDTTISLTNAFGIAAEDLAGKIAFLNAAENQTILSIEDFNEAIPKAGSVVQQLGGDVEDLAFFLTAMREGGINASQGANALKTSLARLIAPTEVAKKEMAGFGIDIVGIVERNAGNLRQTVIELGQELDSLDPLNRARAIEQLFGKFQFARMSTMFQNIAKDGSQANRVLDLTKNSMEELAIIADRELKAVEESPAFKLQKQMEQLKASLAPIGEEFIKAVGPLIEFGTKLLKSFNNLGEGGKQFIVILTAIAGVIAPAALMGFGLIANGVANLLKFFLFLGNAFGRLSGQSTMLGGQTEYMTQQQLEAAAVAASLGQSHSNLTQIFTAEAGAISNLVSQYRAAITAQRQLSIGQTAAGVAARGGARPRGFAKGGIIRGPGSGTSDSIFAMLSNGEAVIPAAMVKKYGPVVDQIIADNVPGYAEGRPRSLSSIKDEVGMYRAPSAIKSQTTNMGWSGLEEEIVAVQEAGRAVMEAQGVEANKVEARLRSLVQKEASHIVPTDVETYSVGDQTMEVKNWKSENLTPDLGYVNNYVNQLEQSPAILEDFEASNLPQAASALGLSMEEAKAEVDKLKQGIHPTSKQSAGMVKAVAESDTKTDPYRTAAVSAGLESRLSGDFYETMEQRSYDPAKDASAAKTQQLRLQNVQQKYSESLGEEVEIKKIPNADVIDPKEAQDLGANAGEGIVKGFKDSLQIASPSKRMFGLGQNAADSLADGFQQGMADETGKPPLPGNLAAPKPPAQPEAAQPGRFGKFFSSAKDKINESKVAQRAADYLGGQDLTDKITLQPGMSDAEREAQRTAKAINQDLFDKGLITEDMQATPLGQTQGITPVRVVDGQLDIGDNSIDQLADASPAANDAAEQDKLIRATKDNRVAQEDVAEATQDLAKSQDQQAKEDKAARKEQKRQNRQARAGKALAGLGTLTMAAGMATQVEGVVGETAQKLVGPLAALSGIAPLLMALPVPIAALIAVIGTGVFLWMRHNKQLKEARENAYNLSKAMGTGEDAMNKFAEFAGNVSSQELLARRIENIGRPMQKQPGTTTFGEAFTQSEAGEEYLKNVEEAVNSRGSEQAVSMLFRQLSSAVVGNVLSVDQARSIAVAIGTAIGDYGVSLDVQAKLLQLIGPNGEDLLKDPLKISTIAIETTVESGEAAAEAIERAQAPIEITDPEVISRFIQERNDFESASMLGDLGVGNMVLGPMADLLDPGFFGAKAADLDELSPTRRAEIEEQYGISAEIMQAALLDPMSEAGQLFFEAAYGTLLENNPEAEIEGFVAAGLKSTAQIMRQERIGESTAELENFYSTLQSGIASTIVAADDALAAAQESGDPEAIAKATQDRATAMANLREENRVLREEARLNLLRVETPERRTAFEAQETRITSNLEGEELRIMQNLLGQLSEVDDEQYETNVVIRGMLEDGDIKASGFKGLLDSLDDEADIALGNVVADMSFDVGENYAAKFAELLTGIEDPEIVSDILFRADNTIRTPDQTIDYINGLASLISLGSIYGEAGDPARAAYEASVLNDPVAAAKRNTSLQRVQGLQGDYSPESLTGEFGEVLGGEISTMINVDREKFDEFEEDTKEQFVTDLIVNLGLSGDPDVVAFIKSQFAGTAIAGSDEVVNTDEEIISGQAQQQFNFYDAMKDITAGDNEPPPPGPTGGGAGPQLDSLLKKLRDVRDASIDLKKGWEGMQEVLSSIFAGGTKELNVFDGLEKQLRNLNLGPNLIAMIIGMDPDEFEKRKSELFNIDGTATEALINMNKAFNAVAIGDYVNGQEKFIEKTRNQISAISILTANGMSLSNAYEAVQDEALAAAVAMGATKEEIQEILKVVQLAKDLEEDLEEQRERSRISDAVRKTNEEFSNQVAILQKLSKAQGQYSDEQIKAIMGDSDLQKIFLDPSIDPKALEAALKNAEQKANLEVQIAIAEGREDELFGQYLTEVNDYFSKEEAVIGVNFEMDTADENQIIQDAQRQIAAIQYQLDDYNAELEQISWAEEDINEKYDKRVEALDEIADANQKIADQQKAQLDIADALSRGDIAAAARAAAELRSQQAQDAQESQKEQLERARAAELNSLTGASGMTREQLEDAITSLERQVFQLEETALEPAQERVRLAEITRDLAIEQLELNGMTRDEFDQIAASTNLAALNMEDMVKSAEKLVAMGEFIRTGEKPANWEELFPTPKAAPPPPRPAPAKSSGPELARKSEWTFAAGANAGKTVAQVAQAQGYAQWQDFYNSNPGGIDRAIIPKIVGRAMGGLIRRSRSGPPLQMAMGGRVKKYANGGMIIPKRMAMGGYSMGSDTVPAILTPGEFVVRRPAVSAFGLDNLEKINRGTYNDGSVYNYNLAVNVRSDSDPNRIARAVITQIKQIDNQRIRSNRI